MDKGEMGGPAANNSSDFVSPKPDCLTDLSCTKSSIGPEIIQVRLFSRSAQRGR